MGLLFDDDNGTSQPTPTPAAPSGGLLFGEQPVTTRETVQKQTAAAEPPKREELPPIFGVAQAGLKAIMTPWAGAIGAIDAVARNENAIKGVGANISSLWGTKDLFGADAWDDIKTGETLLKDTFGVQEERVKVPAAFARNIPGFFTIASSQVAQGKADTPIDIGTNTFWGGLGIDIAVDPLNFGLRGVNQMLKGTAKAAASGARAARLANRGWVSEGVAAKKGILGKESTEIGRIGELRSPQNLETVRENILKADPKAAEKLKKISSNKLAGDYVAVRVPSTEVTNIGFVKDIIASAAEASSKSIANSIVSARTMNFLRKYAKKDTSTFGKTIATKITRDPDGSGYLVLSGNKVILGRAASEYDAKQLANKIKKGLNTEDGVQTITPVGSIQGAVRSVDEAGAETGESISVPAAQGGEVTLEKYVPHDNGDGSLAVYDGENVSVFNNLEDANSWIDIMTGEQAAELAPVISGRSGNYKVTIGTTIRTFKTKKEATAYSEAIKSGEIPVTRRGMTSGGKPVVDTIAPQVTVKEALTVPTTKETSALKSVLSKIDEIAKRTSGWRGELDKNLANTVRKIVSPRQARVDKFLMQVDGKIVKEVKMFVDGDISWGELDSALSNTSNEQRTLMKSLLDNTELQGSTGKITLKEALKKANGNFLKITEAVDGVAGSGLETQAKQYIDNEVVKRSLKLQRREISPAFDSEGKYQALVNVVGEKNAAKFRKTGYLDEASVANRKKFDKVLAELESNNAEVSYQGYDDLIAGLNRGDDISEDALKQIFTVLDPDGGLIAKFEKFASQSNSDFLINVFTRGGGVNSIREAEKRLAMAGDPEILMRHSGLAYMAEVTELIKQADKNKNIIDQLQATQTKQAAAAEFAGRGRETQRDAAESFGRMFMGDPKKAGESGLIAYKNAAKQGASPQERLSTLDDYIYINQEPYTEGSKAAFSRQLQQSGEQKMIASLTGKLRFRREKMPPAERMSWLIERLAAADELATANGFRFVRTKNRDDATFQRAYQKALQEAKDSNTTPNFSAFNNKHTVYLPMHVILDTVNVNGANDALLRAYFPTGRVDYKRDPADWISLGDAARRVLEMDAAGEPIDVAEIVARITKRAPGREKPSPKRQEIIKQAAEEIAETLAKPETITTLKGYHLDAAASVVKDSIEKVETFNADLFNLLDEAWATMHLDNNLSEAARMENVRQYFRKMVLAADILRYEDGAIAEAMFRSMAMTIADGGKPLPASRLGAKLSKKDQEFFSLLRAEEYKLFREALTRYHRYQDIPTAPPGREGMKPPKPASKAKADRELVEAETLYETHMKKLAEVEAEGSPEVIANWEKTQVKLQSKLTKAREKAWENWLPTRHWHPVDGWVPTEKYDQAKALRSAEQANAAYIAGKRGVGDRVKFLADSEPVIPPHRKMSPGEKQKFLAKYRRGMNNAQIENNKSILDDTATNVADEVEAGRLDFDDLSPDEQIMRAKQEMDARALKEATTARVYRARASYKTRIPDNPREFNELYRPLLNPDTPVFGADKLAVRLKGLAERWSGPTGRQDTVTLLRHAETATVQESTNFAEALDSLQIWARKNNLDAQDFDAVWTAIRAGDSVADDASDIQQTLQRNLELFTNILFKSHAQSLLTKEGIDGKILGEMMERFGLKEQYGFPKIGNLNGKTPEELVNDLMNEMPFGAVPEKLRGTDAGIQWEQRRAAFREAGISPLLAFTRLMEAVQMVKMEKGVAHNATAQFGWKSHFKTIDEAIADGWVEIEAVGKQSIARFLPTPEDGGLFHPKIAEQMGSVFREYNNMYEGNQLPEFLRNAMRVMGVIKFTQTTLMPRHHITNAFGDSTTAMIAGVTDPRDWQDGFRIANRFTGSNILADYGKRLGNIFERKAARLDRGIARRGAQAPEVTESEFIPVTIYKNGKPSVENVSIDRLVADWSENGVLVPGFVQADLQGFAGDLALKGATDLQQQALRRVQNYAGRKGRGFMKGFSDFTASYSNGIRAAHAMKVARSRAWSSYEEMQSAILKQINLYHPTVQSLASTERKWGRLLFTYYTWIRVAHSALIDMAVNHTGSMLAIPKGMYNYSVMQGFDPESPAVPFENKNVLPDYISYSVYGPNAMDEQGPRSYRPPFLPLDVLDFWQIYIDPSRPIGENIVSGAQQFGEMVGKSFNILGRPILDVTTGAPMSADPEAAIVDAALSNFGFTSFLTGIGAWTPYRYRDPETTNPLTDADRRRLLENSFSGMRAVDIYRPINVKKGQSQYRSRVNNYNERITEENREKVQEFYNDRVAEGYSHEQIVEILKDLGVGR